MNKDVDLSFDVVPAFADLWEKEARYYILMGGRGQGRSTAASQYAVAYLPSNEYFRCAVMREIHADIRHSIWKEINDRIEEQEAREAFRLADNDMFAKYGRNSIQAHGFKTSSGTQTAKLKSLANYNVVIIEEAEETNEPEFTKLDDSLRTKRGPIRIILCLNSPPKDHWIIRRFFDLKPVPGLKGYYIPTIKPDQDAIYIGGTFEDNIENLDTATIKRYRGYEKTNPEYFYQVIKGYVPETVRGKIYNGWELIDEVPKEAKLLRIGGDWGWFPDPLATIALYYYDNSYIVDGLTYGNEVEDSVVAGDIINVPGGTSVRAVFGADEPKSIEYLRKKGIKAVKSIRGPGSVDTRIKLTAAKRIKVVRKDDPIYGNWVWDCYGKYHWAEDKDGNPKGEPDHLGSDPMDAISYAIADLEEPSSGSKVTTYKPEWSGYGKTGLRVRINTPRPLR